MTFMALETALQHRISELVTQNRVLLFMKGTRHFPQCGFSATVTQILDGLVSDYQTVNVLKDPDIRQGIKEYSNWPTIPQLYVDGKFVGGCDIIREMYLAGELHEGLGVADELEAPKVSLTPAASEAFRAAAGEDAEEGGLRIEINGQFEYALSVDTPQPGDFVVEADGLKLLIDRASATRANGMSIDYSDAGESGFKIDNPNEPPRVKQLSVQELAQMRERGEAFELIDVRTEQEHGTASIEGARLLDDAGRGELLRLDKDTPLVFLCHHGQRSQAAAETFLQQGFTRVFNVRGGIDAWSREVDSSVPRY